MVVQSVICMAAVKEEEEEAGTQTHHCGPPIQMSESPDVESEKVGSTGMHWRQAIARLQV